MTTVYVVPTDMIPAVQDWRRDDVTDYSVSAITGFRRASQSQRRRYFATLTYAHDGRNLGRLEILRDLLRGGANYLQMDRLPGRTAQRSNGSAVTWSNGAAAAVTWSNASAAAVTWRNRGFSRSVYAVSGYVATLRGFAADELVALTGEPVQRNGGTPLAFVASPAQADASGVAEERLSAKVRVGEWLTFGGGETVLMQPVGPISIPRRANYLDDPVTVELRQVFADEIGTYDTVDIWS